ncbi:MAG: hypothetical protein LC624_10740 [Halobacteriales archaeon]|nr:hypothetical protein [Halobacteriales archaeon]
MKAKKLLAALGVLVMIIPGVAFADAASKETQQIVEGHSVYATVLQENNVGMAAIAGIAAKRTTIGGVLWFNNQELVPSSVASEIAAGAFVLASQAGDDSPLQHINDADLAYVESYQFTDPNDRAWIVDRYSYQQCSVGDNPVPCEAAMANDQFVDLDGDGVPDDVAGEPLTTGEPVTNVTKSMYVVEISASTKDLSMSCDALALNGGGTAKDYNFVLLVRMDALDPAGIIADGASLGTGSALTKEQGNSGAAVTNAPSTTANTAQIDLWFSENRPPAPTNRVLFFPADSVGSSAPCA